MSRPNDYGMLLNKDIKLHRSWFKQMTKLIGITCQYRAPLENKTYNQAGDLTAQYPKKGIAVGCIFEEHPNQQSMRKAGWVAELQEGSSVIHVPYDLENLQVGCLFEVPSGLDGTKPRTFRVIKMQNIMIYPASITCEIALEYENIDEPVLHTNFATETLPLLIDVEGDD
jgi:hypothetical protein